MAGLPEETGSKSRGRDEFEASVYPSELAKIRQRRAVWKLPNTKDLDQAAAGAQERTAPDVAHGTVGLAFSGGGIRSATFNLGVLQVLAKRGLLKWFDYLSTVSGGGYIGSNVSTTLASEDPARGAPGYSYVHEQGRNEPVAVEHLRRGGRYLAPGGLLDALKIPALLLRGIVANVLALAPYLGLLALYTAWWYPNLLDHGYTESYLRLELGRVPPQEGQKLNFFLLAPWAMIVFAAWIALFPPVSTFFHKASYKARALYERSFAVLLLLVLAVAAIEAGPVLLRLTDRLVVDTHEEGKVVAALAALIGGLVPVLRSLLNSAKLAGLLERVMVGLAGLLGGALLLVLYMFISAWLLDPGGDLTERRWILGIAVAAVFLYTVWFVNINQSGLHRFYRDRLSTAYLFNPYPTPERPAHADTLRLSDLDVAKSGAPYHLVNATLNLQGTRDPAYKGRGADFLLCSPGWCGSFATGYCETARMEQADADLDLGTAMSVSGAAASPYMGPGSSKLQAFTLTLLNVRLDYWLPNPRRIAAASRMSMGLQGVLCRVGPFYLVMELFGLLGAESRSVDVSDGGHIENLGLYELLRRRCRYILVSDAEEDVTLTLGSLGRVTTYARMDQGIDIRWTNLDLLRNAPNPPAAPDEKPAYRRFVPVQWAHGRIHYGSGETGHIVYLKSSLTGKEPQDILTYHTKNPAFPHQATADQFFDEEQFEAYRALGYGIAGQLFDDGKFTGHVDEWFTGLEKKARDMARAAPAAGASGPAPAAA